MQEPEQNDKVFSFKYYFIPFTNNKAIHWIVIIGLVVYSNMLFNGFVWDDISYIVTNTAFQHFNFIALFQKNIFNGVSQYRPIPALYFSALYYIFHSISFFYHFMQLLIHIANTVLLFLFFSHLFKKKIAFILSLIFLVHPIQVEAVSFIGASDNPLFFLFGMSAFLLSIGEMKSKYKTFSIFILLLLSVLTNETGILFLFIILSYQYLLQKGKTIYYIPPGILTVIIYFVMRFGIGNVFFSKENFVAIGDLTLLQRIFNIPEIFFYYIKTLFFPNQLLIEQQWIVKNINIADFYIPLLIDILFLTIVAIGGMWISKKNEKALPVYIFFFIWFISGIVLHLQIFSLDMTVADRWFYFPFVGILGMTGLIITTMRSKLVQKWLFIIGSLIIILLSIRTMIRNLDWKDDLTLNSHDVKISVNPYDIENNLSYDYIVNHQCETAEYYAKKSIELYPDSYNYMNFGESYFCLGNYGEAKKIFIQAQNFGDDNNLPYDHLADLSLVYGDKKDSIKFLNNTAAKKFPSDPKIWLDLAILEYKNGDTDNATYAIKQAYKYDPSENNYYVYSLMTNHRPLMNVNIHFGE
jgi:tetratricopeptide (TPR) repeat protein